MNPDLEFFLESAFAAMPRSSDQIGRIVIEPDYDVAFDSDDAPSLRQQLTNLLASQHPDQLALGSHDGFELSVGDQHPLLKKYLRRITLHADKVSGDWVEVVPPGNWI